MTASQAARKVKGGKLVQVSLFHNRGIIQEIKITGDFFLHPEDGLLLIEKGLEGLSKKDDIRGFLHDLIERENMILVGFSPDDIADLIEVAMACGD